MLTIRLNETYSNKVLRLKSADVETMEYTYVNGWNKTCLMCIEMVINHNNHAFSIVIVKAFETRTDAESYEEKIESSLDFDSNYETNLTLSYDFINITTMAIPQERI
ncbi:hypothetical protein DCO58_11870 [Helicobacter saguini]|uniref:Uncharacterized protein n=1 Tax=Helicobacter saguini TaxID=1548018 RepID=A0A347VQA8_9HELI|nr:hypothetical protein [Helicobacter saguini]MWV61014.1 hypothetical protein [Helicobacter saguini]MWV68317.1 hypothetical protein [Helicobacter saguini]MWV70218.1 hypothetical protein [Helicobacter saguini]MWV72121.1 hypothetical protein [Helicobacter saguini]TLD91624.1 hypothetical protein LS64_011570 [Helicobacter saguini]